MVEFNGLNLHWLRVFVHWRGCLVNVRFILRGHSLLGLGGTPGQGLLDHERRAILMVDSTSYRCN